MCVVCGMLCGRCCTLLVVPGSLFVAGVCRVFFCFGDCYLLCVVAVKVVVGCPLLVDLILFVMCCCFFGCLLCVCCLLLRALLVACCSLVVCGCCLCVACCVVFMFCWCLRCLLCVVCCCVLFLVVVEWALSLYMFGRRVSFGVVF